MTAPQNEVADHKHALIENLPSNEEVMGQSPAGFWLFFSFYLFSNASLKKSLKKVNQTDFPEQNGVESVKFTLKMEILDQQNVSLSLT